MNATRNIVYRIYPTKSQERILIEWLNLHCELYNAALQERRDAYQKKGVSIKYNDQQNVLPEIKEFRPELIPLGSQALQETLRRVDRAFKAFFRRIKNGETPGYPRFKSKFRYDSFTYPGPPGWKFLGQNGRKGKIRIGNLGIIRMRGKPRVPFSNDQRRTLTIRRNDGRWYAIICIRYEMQDLKRNRAYNDRAVGIDVGCRNLIFTSEGNSIKHPKYDSKELHRLRQAQKKLSRKKKGSCNRAKCIHRVRKIHSRVKNKRKDILHKLSSNLVSLYSLIAIENLNLKNMTKNGGSYKKGLNRSLIDASIGMFFDMLEYKAEEADTLLRKVIPNGTTQECAICGTFVFKDLSTRVHRCPNCKVMLDRDHNAALNILFRALEKAPGPERIGCGEGRWSFDEAGHHSHTALAVGYR